MGTRPLILAASLLVASCEGPAIEPSLSLVGANDLPSAATLSREKVHISRGGDHYGLHPHFLSYELHPDDTLVITYTVKERDTAREAVRARERFRLSRDRAAQARSLLWRVRPARLEWPNEETRPIGCGRRGLHDFGEITIIFIDEGGKAGVGGDRIGAFHLPYASSCNTPEAIIARRLVGHVLQLFPASKAAAAFDRGREASERH